MTMTPIHHFSYHCPNCATTNRIHRERCRWNGTHIHEFEKRYIDILSALLERKAVRNVHGDPTIPMDADWLKTHITEEYGNWDTKHDACLDRLRDESYVVEMDGDLVLLSPDEQRDHVSPASIGGALEAVHEYGACDGCLDNGISAIISWCEMSDFDWDRTREFALDWLDETGTWERGGFEESSPEALVEKKKHIHEQGVGWKTFAKRTAEVMMSEGYIDEEIDLR